MSRAKTPEDKLISRDRMRFIKNKSSAALTYFAILFNVIYFISVYSTDLFFIRAHPEADLTQSTGFAGYYGIIICGVSIVYNLVFMLAAFLASEGLKNYQKNYSYLALVLGLVQFGRIFIIPLNYGKKIISGVEAPIMSSGQVRNCIIYLVASGVCLIVAAVINYIKCSELAAHVKSLESEKA